MLKHRWTAGPRSLWTPILLGGWAVFHMKQVFVSGLKCRPTAYGNNLRSSPVHLQNLFESGLSQRSCGFCVWHIEAMGEVAQEMLVFVVLDHATAPSWGLPSMNEVFASAARDATVLCWVRHQRPWWSLWHGCFQETLSSPGITGLLRTSMRSSMQFFFVSTVSVAPITDQWALSVQLCWWIIVHIYLVDLGNGNERLTCPVLPSWWLYSPGLHFLYG